MLMICKRVLCQTVLSPSVHVWQKLLRGVSYRRTRDSPLDVDVESLVLGEYAVF